jgi:hypothetical protein
MTTKSKTRASPSAKDARKTRAKPAPGGNSIGMLVARWKWLEADQDYRTAVADNGNGDDSHDAEQEAIIAKLRKLVPQDFKELEALVEFVFHDCEICGSVRGDGADIDMLENAHKSLPDIIRAEREISVHAGMQLMREFLSKETTAAIDYATDPEIMQKIRWGTA